MSDENNPLSQTDREAAIVVALAQISDQTVAMTKHVDSLTQWVAKIDARLTGTEAVASVVDENETEAMMRRNIDAQKEVISHLYEKSHQYVTIIVAGAFAAYFATFSTVSQRYSTQELLLSAGLMSVSLMVFILWEIFQICYVSITVIRGTFGKKEMPSWHNPLWGLALLLTLGTGIPAMGLSLWTYVRGLGIF
jgi:hypothetical protein